MSTLTVLADQVASGVLTEALTTAIKSGFADLSATVTQVLVISVPAAVGVIALSQGVNFALRKVRGVLHMAS